MMNPEVRANWLTQLSGDSTDNFPDDDILLAPQRNCLYLGTLQHHLAVHVMEQTVTTEAAEDIQLSPRMFSILAILAAMPNVPIRTTELAAWSHAVYIQALQQATPFTQPPSDANLNVQILWMRQRLNSPYESFIIRRKEGGYMGILEFDPREAFGARLR